MDTNLDEDFWEDLLTLIEDGKVIPVIGSGVVTRGDNGQPLYPWLAQRLAESLGLPPSALPPKPDLNAVATAHLLNRGSSNLLYRRLARILRDECPAPGAPLLDLASVSACNLFLTTTCDPLPSAMTREPPGPKVRASIDLICGLPVTASLSSGL